MAEFAKPEPDEFQDEIQFAPTISSGQLGFGDFQKTQNSTTHWILLIKIDLVQKFITIQDWRNLPIFQIFLKLCCKINTIILIHIF